MRGRDGWWSENCDLVIRSPLQKLHRRRIVGRTDYETPRRGGGAEITKHPDMERLATLQQGWNAADDVLALLPRRGLRHSVGVVDHVDSTTRDAFHPDSPTISRDVPGSKVGVRRLADVDRAQLLEKSSGRGDKGWRSSGRRRTTRETGTRADADADAAITGPLRGCHAFLPAPSSKSAC